MDQTDDTPTSIWVHLEELRRRLFIVVIALIITIIASFSLAQQSLSILARPIGGLANLQAIEVTETIGVYMRISLLGGFILAFPVLLYELIAFTLPGLKSSEKKWLFSAIPFATVLFLGGVAFAYFVMLPSAIPFLTGLLGVRTIPRVSNYINFVTSLLFWIGIGFETPLVIFALVKLKIVSVKTLAKQWRVAIVVIAILSAVITPTVDPVNMGLLMLPLIGLYLLSLLLGLLAG
jgi:sec-independent protein translocase protein TatC